MLLHKRKLSAPFEATSTVRPMLYRSPLLFTIVLDEVMARPGNRRRRRRELIG